jgi:hypothetical protein
MNNLIIKKKKIIITKNGERQKKYLSFLLIKWKKLYNKFNYLRNKKIKIRRLILF